MLGITLSTPKILTVLKARITNPYDVLKESSMFVAGEIDQNFKSGGRPKWMDGKNLHRSGKLRTAATSVTISGNKAEIGARLSEIPYAVVHEFGSRTHPKRSFMNMPAGWAEKVKEVFVGFLTGGQDDTI